MWYRRVGGVKTNIRKLEGGMRCVMTGSIEKTHEQGGWRLQGQSMEVGESGQGATYNRSTKAKIWCMRCCATAMSGRVERLV